MPRRPGRSLAALLFAAGAVAAAALAVPALGTVSLTLRSVHSSSLGRRITLSFSRMLTESPWLLGTFQRAL